MMAASLREISQWPSLANSQHNLPTPLIPLEDKITKAPLNHRGWVLQERMCAPRILHFGKDQIFWECTKKVAAEVHPIFSRGMKPLEKSPLKTEDFGDLIQMTPKWSFGNIPQSLLGDTWHSIVVSYMQCQLTKPEDKLVALSGIAKIFKKTVRTDYLAGLWLNELAKGLLWKVPIGTQATRPSVYRAPSWSWASIDANISYYSPHWAEVFSRSMITVEEAITQPVTNDPTGQVRSGRIRIRGATLNAEYQMVPGGSFNIREYGKDHDVIGGDVRYDILPPFDLQNWNRCTFLLVSQTLYLSPVLPMTRNQLPPKVSVEGLMLEQVSPSDELFERIGYFHFWELFGRKEGPHFGLEKDKNSDCAEFVDQSWMKTIVII
jgi:hypothetical protein